MGSEVPRGRGVQRPGKDTDEVVRTTLEFRVQRGEFSGVSWVGGWGAD